MKKPSFMAAPIFNSWTYIIIVLWNIFEHVLPGGLTLTLHVLFLTGILLAGEASSQYRKHDFDKRVFMAVHFDDIKEASGKIKVDKNGAKIPEEM